MDTCPACGNPYKSDLSKFCSRCGAARPGDVVCGNCGATLEHTDCFCDIGGAQTAYGREVDKALGKE